MKQAQTSQTGIWTRLSVFSGVVMLAACANLPENSHTAMQVLDGDISVPDNYQKWPQFVPTVYKEKNAQIREIYINETGLKNGKGDVFANGTVTVMEIYSAQKDSSGNLQYNSTGQMIKGDLSKIFVMQKGAGWGAQLPAGTINNGDWLYGAYLADGKTPATQDFTACRECHSPMAEDDYIARYDEHFDYRP